MMLITEGKTNWKFLLIVVILGIIAARGILWWVENFPSYQSFGVNELEKISAEECKKYVEDECPEGCIVCPPCEVCSSLGCNSAEFCKSIGFDENWYETIKLQRETANWQIYRSDEYMFEVKYPEDWKVAKNIFNFEPNLVFCPPSLTNPDPEIVCKLKTGATKPQYEDGMIYLFSYNSDPKPNNQKYHYLGSIGGEYYYFYSENNELIVNQMLSTFRFIKNESIDILIWPDAKSFDLINKVFEGTVLSENRRVKILVDGSTKIYSMVDGKQAKSFTFPEFDNLIENWVGPSFGFTIKGFLEEENLIKANEIFYFIQ